MAKVTAFIFCILFVSSLIGQNLTIDGYVYESGNRGFLNVVQITVFDGDDKMLDKTFTDYTGHFEISVPARFKYKIVAFKDMFEETETLLDIQDQGDGDKIFTKIEMKRAPGYMFEISLAEKRDHDSIVVDAIKGSRIEVYNNTKKEEVLVLESHPDPNFEVALQKGNHYTILVRKDGYLGKRMEAFVDVEGCILCFEGIGSVTPGVSDNLSEGNEFGVLLANVELDKIYEGKTIPISNINYEFGKAELKKNYEEGLLNLATIMKDNPDLTIELGSHTDARGTEEANALLSLKRAKNVVDFLVEHGVNKSRLISRGYGESKILNECDNFTECPDYKHRKNRRTELKVIGISPVKAPVKSLAQIKQMEEGEALLEEIQFGGGIQVPADSSKVSQDGFDMDSLARVLEVDKADLIQHGTEKTEKVTTKESIKEKLNLLKEETTTEIDIESQKNAITGESESEELQSNSINEPNEDLGSQDAMLEIFSIVIAEKDSPVAKDDELHQRHTFLRQHEIGDTYLYTIGDYTDASEASSFLKTAKLAYPDAYIVKVIGDKVYRN